MSLHEFVPKSKQSPINLKVKGDSSLNQIEFKTLKEFDNYYTINKDVLDKTPTLRLNRMFKITQSDANDELAQYKIKRENGVILLQKINHNVKYDAQLREDIAEIKEQLNEIMIILQNLEEK